MRRIYNVKFISFVLSAVILMCSFCTVGFAEKSLFGYAPVSGSENEINVMNCTEDVAVDGKVVIPSEIDGKTVTGIGECAFWNHSFIKEIVIPSTVKRIGEMAFNGCSQLTGINLKSTDCEIGYGAFSNTPWLSNQKSDYVCIGSTLVSYRGNDETVYIPYNIINIGFNAFANNKTVKTVIFAEETEIVGKRAFYNCTELENIVIPDACNIKKIGEFAFDGTKWINNYHGDFVIADSVLVRYKGDDSEVVIPNSVTEISSGAFASLKDGIASRLMIPYSVNKFNDGCLNIGSDSYSYPALYVYKNSEGEKYAAANNLKYTVLATPGDVNIDGKVTVADTRKILRVVAKLDKALSVSETYGADIDNDGRITVSDARAVLCMVAKISPFTDKDYLAMPKTGYEVLEEISSALSYAQVSSGFDYYSYQNITENDMNLSASNHLDILTDGFVSEKKAVATSFEPGSPESASKIYVPSLRNSGLIKSYTCKYSDGKYIINVILNDETVNGNSSDNGDTAKLFPVMTVSDIKNKFAGERWYNAENPSFGFAVTYSDCSVSLTVDIKTNTVEALSYGMNYKIMFDGKINGIDIRSTKGNGTASVSVHNVAIYRNINQIVL